MENEVTTNALALPDEQSFRRDIEAINRFQKIVHSNMVEGQDYGVIPGTQKPTLLKPGAEKIAKLLKLSDQYEFVDRQENWERPFFRFLIRCKLVFIPTGTLISEGLGECNSMETKYRWRESKRKCPTCGQETIIKGKQEYGGGWLCFKKQGGCGATFADDAPTIINQKVGRIENPDVFDQVNTIVKMAKKRALVDAALSAGRLSDVFTQDMEDIAPPAKTETKAPDKTIVKESVQPEKQEDSLFPTERPVDMPDTITDGVKLFAFAGKHGITLAKFNSLVQCAPNEVKDVAAAWKVIFPDGVK